MAEGLFNHIAKNGVDGMEDYTALSAGIFALKVMAPTLRR